MRATSHVEGRPEPVVPVLRQVPVLGPDDSVGRAVDVLRYGGVDTLPVVDGSGRLLGVLGLAELRPLVQAAETSLLGPIGRWARRPSAVGTTRMGLQEVREILARSGETFLMLVDERGVYVGAVGLGDLLAPPPVQPRPTGVGGMATPWGVYLTSGGLQAGASNRALIASGVVLGLLLSASNGAVGLSAWIVQRLSGWPLFALWSAPQPSAVAVQNAGWVLLQALLLPIFLLLLRLLPLTGYHAAEHQAVHALERGEPLAPEVLRRMPRVHPRCGTNLLAAGLMFGVVSQAGAVLGRWGLDAANAAVLGAIVALFTWRSVGAFLQQHFTTRPASEEHLRAGVAAAEELSRKYLETPPRRLTLARRLWCMGMPQTLVGVAIGAGAGLLLLQVALQYIG